MYFVPGFLWHDTIRSSPLYDWYASIWQELILKKGLNTRLFLVSYSPIIIAATQALKINFEIK